MTDETIIPFTPRAVPPVPPPPADHLAAALDLLGKFSHNLGELAKVQLTSGELTSAIVRDMAEVKQGMVAVLVLVAAIAQRQTELLAAVSPADGSSCASPGRGLSPGPAAHSL